MKNTTRWSSPKTNIFAGMNDLRKALATENNARLIRAFNEECEFPIKEKQADTDFRNYKRMYGKVSSVNEIEKNGGTTEKYLSLNYVSMFGDREAVYHYYKTGELKKDSLHTPGFSFLVQVDDLIKYYEDAGDWKNFHSYRKQYRAPNYSDAKFSFDFYSYVHGSPYAVRKFKKRLWVVELLKEEEEKPKTPFLVHLISILAYPLKWIPSRDVLRMDKYKCITYRIGDVTNGLSIQFHIPKKFSFN